MPRSDPSHIPFTTGHRSRKGHEMHRIRLLVCGVLLVAGVVSSSSAALASPASTPSPTPGTPGCIGLVVAFENHDSGPFGASGNSTSSAGPGYFLRSDTAAAIAGVREEFCSP
jgi:hypothetical protein